MNWIGFILVLIGIPFTWCEHGSFKRVFGCTLLTLGVLFATILCLVASKYWFVAIGVLVTILDVLALLTAISTYNENDPSDNKRESFLRELKRYKQ